MDGNLLQDDKWQYTWDAENRLVRQKSLAWLAEAGAGPRLDISYRYDYLGRRVTKRVLTVDAADLPVAQREHQYYYAGWNLVAEAVLDDTTTLPVFVRSYTWGLGVNGGLSANGGAGALLQITDHNDGQRYLPAYDGNGNVSALIKVSDGTVAAAYEYSPYGESLRGPAGGIASDNPFRFSTKFTDQETGLLNYGMRYYNPETGRFVNRDPIEESGGLNLYAFCQNDGINRHDILGLSSGRMSIEAWERLSEKQQSEIWKINDVVFHGDEVRFRRDTPREPRDDERAEPGFYDRYGNFKEAPSALDVHYAYFAAREIRLEEYEKRKRAPVPYVTIGPLIDPETGKVYEPAEPPKRTTVAPPPLLARNAPNSAGYGQGTGSGTTSNSFVYFQEQANSCGPASCRNAISVVGGTPGTEAQLRGQVATAANRANANFETSGLTLAQAQSGIPGALSNYNLTGSFTRSNLMSVGEISTLLQGGQAAIVGYTQSWHGPGGHIVTVQYNQSNQQVIVYDPWRSSSTQQNGTTTTSSATNFFLTRTPDFIVIVNPNPSPGAVGTGP